MGKRPKIDIFKMWPEEAAKFRRDIAGNVAEFLKGYDLSMVSPADLKNLQRITNYQDYPEHLPSTETLFKLGQLLGGTPPYLFLRPSPKVQGSERRVSDPARRRITVHVRKS